MALIISNRVREGSTSVGTGPFTLAGSALGYKTFAAAIGAGNTTYYAIVSTLGQWEIGLGTLTAGQLARTTVLDSSSAGALVDFVLGTKDVFTTIPAECALIQPLQTSEDALINGVSVGRGRGDSSSNTALGAFALANNTPTFSEGDPIGGYNNTATGFRSLYSNTTGFDNTATGVDALYSISTGYRNTATGMGALCFNSTGNHNTATGFDALHYNTAPNNTANGHEALFLNSSGSGNTAVGVGALSSNTFFSNCSGFGFQTAVTGSNQVQLGNTSTTTYVYGTVQNRSDLRDKADVRDTVLGLEFINALRPVDYRWDMREDYQPPRPADLQENATDVQKAAHKIAIDAWLETCKLDNLSPNGTKKRLRYHHGLIAQEVKTVMTAQGIDFGGYQDHKIQGGHDVLSIGYDELIAPLIKAVQQLSAQNAALTARVAALETK